MRQIILAINALLKFKAYTLINVLGLACSLACVLTVARYIHQENTVNQCFPEYKRICLIKTSTSSGENFLGGYRSGLEKNPDVEQFTVKNSPHEGCCHHPFFLEEEAGREECHRRYFQKHKRE